MPTRTLYISSEHEGIWRELRVFARQQGISMSELMLQGMYNAMKSPQESQAQSKLEQIRQILEK